MASGTITPGLGKNVCTASRSVHCPCPTFAFLIIFSSVPPNVCTRTALVQLPTLTCASPHHMPGRTHSNPHNITPTSTCHSTHTPYNTRLSKMPRRYEFSKHKNLKKQQWTCEKFIPIHIPAFSRPFSPVLVYYWHACSSHRGLSTPSQGTSAMPRTNT